MLEDSTLREVFHIRMSALGAFSFLTLVFVLILALFSVLIIYTPVRNILPGYSASIRQQLVDESARVDSLQADLTLQRQYLDVIKHVTAGDIKSDSVQSLDSMQIVQRTQLLEQRNAATDAFVAQYEQKERDQLYIFDNQAGSPQVFARPVKGRNVMAVLRGTVIFLQRDLDNTYTVVVQHQQYTAIYRCVEAVLKPVGTQVEAGEAIGMVRKEQDLSLELWKNGTKINPDDVIAF